MDKIIQNRHRKEGWEEVEEEWRVFSSFSPLLFLLFIAGWNYSKLIFLFILFFLNYKYILTLDSLFNTYLDKYNFLNVFFCPDGITPNSGLTGPNNTIYIYIYIYICVCVCVCVCVSVCVCVVIYEAFCFNVAQGRMLI